MRLPKHPRFVDQNTRKARALSWHLIIEVYKNERWTKQNIKLSEHTVLCLTQNMADSYCSDCKRLIERSSITPPATPSAPNVVWSSKLTLLTDCKTYTNSFGNYLSYFPLCMWEFLSLCMASRNLFCCQWGCKERNWASKRIYCETSGGRDGAFCWNGNYTCRRLSGEFVLFFTSLACFPVLYLMQINFNFILQRRFCSNLGMIDQAVKAAQETVQKAEELDIRLVLVCLWGIEKLL